MPQSIREKLGLPSEEEIAAKAKMYSDFADEYREALEEVEWQTEVDESLPLDLKTRDSTDVLNRGVDRLLSVYNNTAGSLGIDLEATPIVKSGGVTLITSRAQWLAEMKYDLLSNFIYQEYLDQLFSEAPIAASYPTYTLYCAIKAALHYLASSPDATEELHLLTTTRDFIYDELTAQPVETHAYPFRRMRDEAIKFIEWQRVGELECNDIGSYIVAAETYVPRIIEVADQLLARYSDAVRVERENYASRTIPGMDTPLPDEPLGTFTERQTRSMRKDLSEIRMTRAITAYQNDVDGPSVKAIAKEYGVGQHALRKRLKEKGLLRGWGGDRKANGKDL